MVLPVNSHLLECSPAAGPGGHLFYRPATSDDVVLAVRGPDKVMIRHFNVNIKTVERADGLPREGAAVQLSVA